MNAIPTVLSVVVVRETAATSTVWFGDYSLNIQDSLEPGTLSLSLRLAWSGLTLWLKLKLLTSSILESCTGNCPSHSVSHSLTLKVNVNFLLPNKRENVLVSSVLGGNTSARYSLLLILTVHFVINTCLAYNNPSLF